jgi:acetyltransferase-like isoleucine patch superfamily enzyme
MRNLISYIWEKKWAFRSLLSSIYLNFKYLPFCQAVKLPILLYKPQFIALEGKIEIQSDVVKTGMAQWGAFLCSLYPNNGISIEIHGKLVLKGSCIIGNNAFLSIHRNGVLVIGNGFCNSTSLKLACFNDIQFDNFVRFGWNCLVCDGNSHPMKDIKRNKEIPTVGKIKIGSYVWIANNSVVYKNTKLPDNTIVSSHSLVNHDFSEIPPFSLLAGIPAVLKKVGIKRTDFEDS